MSLCYDNTLLPDYTHWGCWSVESSSYLDELVHDSYMWDNSETSWFEYPNPTPYITEDVDYFPNQEYSYTPYTYPHPLQSAGTPSWSGIAFGRSGLGKLFGRALSAIAKFMGR